MVQCLQHQETTTGSLRASFPGLSGGGEVKERRACNYALGLEFHLQFPCGSSSTELLDFRQSAQSGNERKCKQILKNTCQGNKVITNVISANQHFVSTFSTQKFKFQRRSCKPSFLFPAPPSELPGELAPTTEGNLRLRPAIRRLSPQ